MSGDDESGDGARGLPTLSAVVACDEWAQSNLRQCSVLSILPVHGTEEGHRELCEVHVRHQSQQRCQRRDCSHHLLSRCQACCLHIASISLQFMLLLLPPPGLHETERRGSHLLNINERSWTI